MDFLMCCPRAVATPDPWNSRPDSRKDFQGSGIRTKYAMVNPFLSEFRRYCLENVLIADKNKPNFCSSIYSKYVLSSDGGFPKF